MERELNFDTVTVLDNVKISTAEDVEELKQFLLKESCSSTTAFVIRNAERAPFADIVVLIPGASTLILVQCKNYSSKTVFTEQMALVELRKMGTTLPS